MRGSAALILTLPQGLHACPGCFGEGPNASGLFWGALFLLPLPFLAAWALWKIYKSGGQGGPGPGD